MSFQKRRPVILKTIEEKGSADVRELAQLLNTSEITIRRDLLTLAADGLVYRTHGGAMSVRLATEPLRFDQKTALHHEVKTRLARAAAQQVEDGDVVFLDCGSTVFRMCAFLKNRRIRVVTNSLPVAYELVGSTVSVNLAGGEVDAERQAMHGSMAEEHLSRYRATKAFVGVDGLSLQNGLSAFSEKEAGITLAMTRHAERSYLLCDASKLERDRYFPFAPLDRVQVLVTDAEGPLLQAYRARIEVLGPA